MLHLNFALNLEKLADKMIDEICGSWKDPFKAPVVIFPDPKQEQWFRHRWVKKKGVLANLNKSTIDRFLFDILVGDNDSRHKLTADMLTNVILAYLTQVDASGIENYRNLDPEVDRYLCDEKGVLDENRLYDFASKMAALFLEYETSRPASFARNAKGEAPGFLERWKDGALQPFFAENNKSIHDREAWQQKLYAAVFHNGIDSLLSNVFQKEAELSGTKREFLTIPFLYSECLTKGGGKHAKFYDEKYKDFPVFIFGLSGMGQFYRVILQEYARDHEIYAYIQNPCMEFWEDSAIDPKKVCRQWKVTQGKWASVQAGDIGHIKEKMKVREIAGEAGTEPVTDVDDISETVTDENELLANWGRSGRDNIKLWCQASNYDFDFEGVDKADLPQDTLLHKVQYAVAHRTALSKIDDENLKDGSLTVAAAPTKIREIEHLHSEICKLIKNDSRIEDILVVSPNLDEYRTAIRTVFDQTPVKGPSKDQTGYLHIPFTIVDSPARNSLTENALKNLFAILGQKTITRPDFFELVRNPVVQMARGFQNEDVDAWQEWVAETNTFRNRQNGSSQGDWGRIVRRLLLAQMTSNDSIFNGEMLRPFSDMACSDKQSLSHFVECVNDLEKWLDFGKGPIVNLDSLLEHIDKWIAMPYTPDALKSESVIYKHVADGLKHLRWQFDAGSTGISIKIVEQTLLQAAQGTEYSCGNLFVNGITFMKFAPNRVLPVKHLFFIGADGMSFPGSKQHNTLDLRKALYPWPGDESPIFKNRYGFLCLLMSTGVSFHLSYVNKDTKKDAELYPSSVINDLRKFIEKEGSTQKPLHWAELPIPLDETRHFSELFTPRSLRNWEAYERMFQKADKSSSVQPKKGLGDKANSKIKEYVVKLPERVSIHALADFLQDPFQFRISQMLMSEDDEDIEKELFEPIYFNRLDTSIVLKKMLAADLSGEEDELDKFKKELMLKGKSPDGNFGEKQWATLEAKKSLIVEQMNADTKNPNLVQEIRTNWAFGQKIQDLQLSRSDGSHWLLSGKMSWSNSTDVALTTRLIEISSADKKNSDLSFDKYMTPYVKALAIIALKGNANPEFANKSQKVDISIYTCDKELNGPAKAFVEMTPEEASAMLEKIYAAAFGDENSKTAPYSKSVPIDMLDNKKVTNIYSYAEELFKGSWNYFDKKSLFNPCEDTGFSTNNFKEEWAKAVMQMKSLVAVNKVEAEA